MLTRSGPEARFQQFLDEGRFMIQRCRTSGRYVFYPRVADPASAAARLEWVEASGAGTVYSVTIVRPKPPDQPYVVALIDLAEGPRMLSTVEGLPPQDVTIGMQVRARIVSRADRSIVVFERMRPTHE